MSDFDKEVMDTWRGVAVGKEYQNRDFPNMHCKVVSRTSEVFPAYVTIENLDPIGGVIQMHGENFAATFMEVK